MKLDLTGRAALVTGSSQGIGLAIAAELAGAGATVAVNGRSPAKVTAAIERLAARVPGAALLPAPADLAGQDCAAGA